MKRHKDPVQASETNKDAHVFVLPPDILEKLGIQLSNIPSSTTSAENVPVVNQDQKNYEEVSGDVSNSSILETANLMKQSVFMSPTFVTTTEIQDDPVSDNTTNEAENTIHNIESDKGLVGTLTKADNFEDSVNVKIINNPITNSSENFMKYETIHEYEVDIDSGDLILTKPNENFKNVNTVSDMTNISPIDEHVDEAYSSDGSNSNLGIVSDITGSNLLLDKVEQNRNTKIEIISEKIIQNSDLGNLNRTQTGKQNSCFLIPVNTIVSRKVPKEDSHKQSNVNVADDYSRLRTSCQNTKHGSIFKNVGIVDDKLIIEDINPLTKITDNDTNEYKKAESESNVDSGLIPIDRKENYEISEMFDITTEKATNTENILINSKLSIQGVEKPGGSFKYFNGMKTYERKNIQKQIPKICHDDGNKFSHENNLLEELEANLNEINIRGYKNANKFCNCNDFGMIAHYSDDDTCEHIHFHDHSISTGSLENVLSMYHDDCDMYNRCETEFNETVSDNEITGYDICWLSLTGEDEQNINKQPIELHMVKCDIGQTKNLRRRSIKSTQEKHGITAEEINAKTQVTRKSSRKSSSGLSNTPSNIKTSSNDSSPKIPKDKTKQSTQNTVISHIKDTAFIIDTSRPKDKNIQDKKITLIKSPKANYSIASSKEINKQSGSNKIEQTSELPVKKMKLTNTAIKVDDKTLKETSISEKNSIPKNIKSVVVVNDKNISSIEKNEMGPKVGATKNNPAKSTKSNESNEISPNKVLPPKESSGSKLKEIDLFASTMPVFEHKNGKKISSQKLVKVPKLDNSNEKSSNLSEKQHNHSKLKTLDDEQRISLKSCSSANKVIVDRTPTSTDVGTPKSEKKSKSTTVEPVKVTTNISKTLSQSDHHVKSITLEDKNEKKSLPGATASQISAPSNAKLGNTEILSAETTSTGNSSTPIANSQSSSEASGSNVQQNIAGSQDSNTSKSADGSGEDNPPPAEKNYVIEILKKVPVKCGVCKEELDESKWHEHIEREHNYLAWREYETPLDLTNEDAIRIHLCEMVKQYGELRCFKCKTIRKYAKAYRTHVRNCEFNEIHLDTSAASADITLEGDNSQRSLLDVTKNSSPKTDDDKKPRPRPSYTPRRRKRRVRKPRQTICGVCNETVFETDWIDHIRIEHKYLAWKSGEKPVNLNDDIEVKIYLQTVSRNYGGLVCSKCGVVKIYVKSWVEHEASCNGEKHTSKVKDEDDVPLKPRVKKKPRKSVPVARPPDVATCALCNESVSNKMWIEHIRLQHNYLAWKVGEPPLDLKDDVKVKIFLQNISNYNRGLICSKCGAKRSYVKKWIEHQAACTGDVANDSSSSEDLPLAGHRSTHRVEIEIAPEPVLPVLPDIVKCGKCSQEMPNKDWISHIENNHDYLAWIEGVEPVLNEEDPDELNIHLHALVKKIGCLMCVKCGASRKYPKSFLTHVKACQMSGFKREDFYVEVSADVGKNQFECAVCLEKGPLEDWKKHAMRRHYNIAWKTGEIPINLKNPYAVEKYLKAYKAKHSVLVCRVCQASRASCYGFYAHILTCGKQESELADLMNTCDICNNTYLCIYRNQHIQMHREQEKAKEKKELKLAAIKAEQEQRLLELDDITMESPKSKRKAAEKAQKVMGNYTGSKGSHICVTCHNGFETEDQLKEHICEGPANDSDSDASVKLEDHEESDDDMEVDSNASAEEEQDSTKRKKKRPESTPKVFLPFKIINPTTYLQKSYDDYIKRHRAMDNLFNDFRCKSYTILTKEEAVDYMPSLTVSCKLRVEEEWRTYERFQADKIRDKMTLFTGAAIRCVRWVPIRSDKLDNYLSVSCFRGSDCPRYSKDAVYEHPGLVQLWKFGMFMSVPKLVFGIAHDFGTVWAMEWCPSGARDAEPEGGGFGDVEPRLGLLALACSNGKAYVLSVPMLRKEEDGDPVFIKLKPVAELRVSMKTNDVSTRKKHQATAISWSPQKGHELVTVGYSDGTVAYYNLATKSPFLRSVEDDVQIIYPFHDALTENSPVTGLSLTSCQDDTRLIGNVASASVTGATLSAWPGTGPVARSHLSCSSLTSTPNWPAAVMCSDDVLTSKAANVLEWWGGGRRVGGGCAGGACLACGRLCLAAPPFVRIMRPHPAQPDLKKQIISVLRMVPIAMKRKLKTDDLGMVIEPITYEETILKYGLEFQMLSKKNQKVSQLTSVAEQCPERFPLSDMPCVTFCPSAIHHNRLAIASHAGFLFVIIT